MRPGAKNGLQTFVVLGYKETSLGFLHDCYEPCRPYLCDHDENHAYGEDLYLADAHGLR